MDRSEIHAWLSGQLGSLLEKDPADIKESSRLFDDLDADSLDILEIIVALKEQYSISVSDGEAKVFLSELARFVPDKSFQSDNGSLTDEQLAEVASKLTVATMIDFVNDRLPENA
ncbi:MAG TPA: phosphopantetheine-binding protein [Streptomyces sp.]|nr:phosphopantetheine-binding protein [Streptomyces sp.]